MNDDEIIEKYNKQEDRVINADKYVGDTGDFYLVAGFKLTDGQRCLVNFRK